MAYGDVLQCVQAHRKGGKIKGLSRLANNNLKLNYNNGPPNKRARSKIEM